MRCGGRRGRSRSRESRVRSLARAKRQGEGFLDNIIVVAALLGDPAPVDQYAPKLQERIDTDAFYGPQLEEAIAAARAQLGQNDAAIAILRHLLQRPGGFGDNRTAARRSDVGRIARRSVFPGTRRGKAVNLGNFFAELRRRNVYRVAVA